MALSEVSIAPIGKKILFSYIFYLFYFDTLSRASRINCSWADSISAYSFGPLNPPCWDRSCTVLACPFLFPQTAANGPFDQHHTDTR